MVRTRALSANDAEKISEDKKSDRISKFTSDGKPGLPDENIQEKNQQKFLENQLKCSICLELYVKATVAIAHERINEQIVRRCGHTFCEDCINTSMRTNSSKCPLCRSRIILTTPNHALESFINRFVDTHFSNEAKIARANLLKEREEDKMRSNTEAENRVPRQHLPYIEVMDFFRFDQESNQDESSDSDDSIPDLELSPVESNNIDFIYGDENNENVGLIQRYTRSMRRRLRRSGITDEMVREGVFGNLEENHLDDESDWTPEGATGGRGYITNMPNMQTMANIQQALDSLGGGQSRNNPMSRPNNFDDSLPDIEAAVEGAAYSHMRYQRRLQVPGVFVTEGHNTVSRIEGVMDSNGNDTLANNFDVDESNIIDASTNGNENNNDLRVIGNIDPDVWEHAFFQNIVRRNLTIDERDGSTHPIDLIRDGIQENHEDDERGANIQALDLSSGDDQSENNPTANSLTNQEANQDESSDGSDDSIPDLENQDVANGDENIEDTGLNYIQRHVRRLRRYGLIDYYLGSQENHEENHQDDESSDDIDVMPDLVDIVDNADGVGNDDDEVDNSDVNSDDVGTDQVNVDNSDDVIPDLVDIVDNTNGVGNDDDEVDNSDVNSDDVGTDQINVDNTDDVNEDDDDVDNIDLWFVYVSRLKTFATTY